MLSVFSWPTKSSSWFHEISPPLSWSFPTPTHIASVYPYLFVHGLLIDLKHSVLCFDLGLTSFLWPLQGWDHVFITFKSRVIYSLHLALQFSSVTQSCQTLCNPMNCSTPGLPVHHHLQEFTQTHVHRVGDAIQPSHPLLSLSPPAPNPSQHQSLFQWVNYSHEVAKVLEFQL